MKRPFYLYSLQIDMKKPANHFQDESQDYICVLKMDFVEDYVENLYVEMVLLS